MNEEIEKTEKTVKRKRQPREACVLLPLKWFMSIAVTLASLTSAASVYTVMLHVQLSEAKAGKEQAEQALNHILKGGDRNKDGKKVMSMRHTRAEIIEAAATCSQRFNVRPDILLAVWKDESQHDNWAVNDTSGATSIGQIIPGNFQELQDAGIIDQPADLILDLTKAACSSAYFLADYTNRGRGDAWALAAYNAGPGRTHMGMEYSENVMKHVRSGAIHP